MPTARIVAARPTMSPRSFMEPLTSPLIIGRPGLRSVPSVWGGEESWELLGDERT
jgi:hypothetical protein